VTPLPFSNYCLGDRQESTGGPIEPRNSFDKRDSEPTVLALPMMLDGYSVGFLLHIAKRRELFVPGRNGKQLLDMTLTCLPSVDGNHGS
jgi:hypothetical protein